MQNILLYFFKKICIVVCKYLIYSEMTIIEKIKYLNKILKYLKKN